MQLYFKTYGTGHPLIILHGLFGSSNNWSTLSRRFGELWKVYAVDQRNHGKSPHSPDIDFPLMAADLEELMAAEGLPSAFVLGHSMGGKTAMEFALAHPNRVDRLVVADVSPRAYPPGHDAILDAMKHLDLSRIHTRQDADAALAPDVPNSDVRQFILTNLSRTDSSYQWRLNLDALDRNYSRILSALDLTRVFKNPSLFIAGGNSQYLLPQDSSLITKSFPNATFATIPHAGHWIHADAPEEFARLVITFLTQGHTT